MGSGLKTPGPPAIIIGYSSPLSLLFIGIFARFSIF
ncbi:unnamed protein product, partial [marine sediment metagenome]